MNINETRVKVWRVETEGGDGPYCDGSDISEELGWAHAGSGSHPGPGGSAEWGSELSENEGCIEAFHFGFESRKQMRQWFKGWGKQLSEAGFIVSEYEVSDVFVLRGNYQLAFIRDNARLVKTHDPATVIR